MSPGHCAAAAVQVGPRSASSHSRHSTSSRSAAPPEKISVTVPDGRVGLGEFDREQVQHRVLGGRAHIAAAESEHALETERGAAPLIAGLPRRGLPVEPVEAEHQALLRRPPDDVADLDDGVLQMGRDDLDVVLVERNEFQRVHGQYEWVACTG